MPGMISASRSTVLLMRRAWFQLHDQQQYTWYAQHDFNFRISSIRNMPSMISSSGSRDALSLISDQQDIDTPSMFQLNQMINMCRWSTVHLILPACVFRISGTYHTPSVTCMTMTVHETPSTKLAWGPTVTHADNYTQHGFSLQNQWQQAFDEEGGKWYTVWFLLLGQQ